MNLIIFGPQGCGKGTQAQLISQKLGYTHLSTGDVFRDEIKKGSELGKLADSLINDGNLVPDDITNKIVLNKIIKLNSINTKVILDGYPRNISQAKFLLENKISIDHIIVLEINDNISIKRINSRYHCPNCNTDYNIAYNKLKPKLEGICDKCGSKLVQRDDDHIESIKKRLEIYHNQTKPIFELFSEKTIFINGIKSIEDVNKEIIEKLKL
jgi:adenylate kinase